MRKGMKPQVPTTVQRSAPLAAVAVLLAITLGFLPWSATAQGGLKGFTCDTVLGCYGGERDCAEFTGTIKAEVDTPFGGIEAGAEVTFYCYEAAPK